jgi:hypothetical protein
MDIIGIMAEPKGSNSVWELMSNEWAKERLATTDRDNLVDAIRAKL